MDTIKYEDIFENDKKLKAITSLFMKYISIRKNIMEDDLSQRQDPWLVQMCWIIVTLYGAGGPAEENSWKAITYVFVTFQALQLFSSLACESVVRVLWSRKEQNMSVNLNDAAMAGNVEEVLIRLNMGEDVNQKYYPR